MSVLTPEREACIVGLKLTHDSSIAVLRGDKLTHLVELEKLGRKRYAQAQGIRDVDVLLEAVGLSPESIDLLAIDGWHRNADGVLALRDRSTFAIAPYDVNQSVPRDWVSEMVRSSWRGLPTVSAPHSVGHVLTATSTNPNLVPGEASVVLVWDGSLPPTLYERKGSTIRALYRISNLTLDAYSLAALHLEPFRGGSETKVVRDRLDVAGKVMSYIALGESSDDLEERVRELLNSALRQSRAGSPSRGFAEQVSRDERIWDGKPSSATVLLAVHNVLGEHLLRGIEKVCQGYPGGPPHLSLAGGAGLNIKWNSRIRNAEVAKSVWVPPIPNDSGSALGAALAGQLSRLDGGNGPLAWTAYAGTPLRPAARRGTQLRIDELAELLATGQPVVLLQGNAEIGPRALGHRSILADPRRTFMKEWLNAIKGREWYRPIAPVCVESDAEKFFTPGGRDQYMVFDHRIRSEWRSRLPAVTHLDGTARLQTVSASDDAFTVNLLRAFESLTELPILCNTSANRNGYGFFRSVEEALRWGRVKYVFSDGQLFESSDASIIPPPSGGLNGV